MFCTNSPLQEAAATGLEQADERGFITQQVKDYDERRRILTDCFDEIGIKYTRPVGTYFILLVRVAVKYLKIALSDRCR